MDKIAPSSWRSPRRSFTTLSLGASLLTVTLVGGCGLEPIGTDLSACVTQPCANAGGAGSTAATGGGGPVGSGGVAPGGTGGAGAGGTPTTGGANGSGGIVGGGGAPGSGGAGEPCTNVQPPDELHDWDGATCDQWANEAMTDVCSEEWFAEYCDESCGRCTQSGTGGGGNGSGGGNDGSGGGLGDDNPWGNVTGGQNGWASRYWDCCKQSCGWAENAGGNPVDTCGGNGSNVIGAGDQSACGNGPATTCNSFAPWAYSNAVSFGFVATHAGSGVSCGTCYQIQFTGQGQHNAGDPGSQAIAGKVMIVMAANIGGDVNPDGQLDLLIPGGGVGIATGGNFGCDSVWGVTEGELGDPYGGLRAGCSGDLNSVKNCLAQKCESVFGSRGLDDMYDGCMWYANWLNAADNPKFTSKQIECPQELVQVSGR